MAGKDAAVLTAAQAFMLECQTDLYEFGLAQTQELRGENGYDDYREEAAHVLRYMVHRRNFTSTNGSYSMVNPATDACMNVSVYMWLAEMARRAGISPIFETIPNKAFSNTDTKEVEWYAIIVAVPPHLAKDFNDVCQAHLTGKVPVPDDEEDEAASAPPRRRPGRPKKSRKTNPDAPGPNTHRASWRRVTSAKDLLAAVHRSNMVNDDDIVTRINWDVDTQEMEMSEAPVGINTIPMLFSLELALDRESVQQQLADTNVPEYVKDARTYVDIEDGKQFFTVPGMVYTVAPWTMRRIHIADRCINPCADSLFKYRLPNSQVSVDLLRERWSKIEAFNGRKRSHQSMSDEEFMDQFIGPNAKHRRYSHSVEVTCKNPLSVKKGITYSAQWKQVLYPMTEEIAEMNRIKKQNVMKAVENGDMASTELFRIHGDVADSVQSELETDTLGTVPYYKEVYEDFQRLRREIKRDNKIAKMARALLYYDENASNSAADMPSFDKGLLSMSDAITNGHNVTPQQLSVVMKILITMFGAARHEFIPCVAIALFGRSDVGKSYCIKKVTSLLPQSMQEAENDSSEKAWVLDGTSPFKFCWMDEIGTGLSEGKGKSQSRDSKNMQAGMSNAVMSYKQYNRSAAEGGLGDHLRHIHVDCRKMYAITSNRLLNDAMMSRVDPIPTYDDKKGAKGTTRLARSTCNPNSDMSQAVSLCTQLIMSASVFVWAFHAHGGFVREIDESLFEVFVAAQSKVLGQEQMKCRKVDRLKQNSVSLMVFAFVNELLRKRENEPILDDFHRLCALIIARCSVVPLRMIEAAFSLGTPSAEFSETIRTALKGIKKQMVIDTSYEPQACTDGLYYVTKVRDVSDVYKSCEMQGTPENMDVLGSSITQLECTNSKGQFAAKYDGNGFLCIIKDVIDDADIMTDVETGIVEWLAAIYNTKLHGSVWRYDFHENHILFDQKIALLLSSMEQINNNATYKQLSSMLDFPSHLRKTALNALKRSKIKIAGRDTGEKVITMSTSHEEPYNGMMLHAPDDVQGFGSVPTTDDGPVAGMHKKKICMAGALRVPLKFLKSFANTQQRANAVLQAHEDFSNILHACSGEVKVGDQLFRAFSKETDHETCSAQTSKVGQPTKTSVTYKNPRVMAANNVYNQESYYEYDDLHREDQVNVTIRSGDNITRKRVEKRVRENTGCSLDEWEHRWQLPKYFDGPVHSSNNESSGAASTSIHEDAITEQERNEAMQAIAALNNDNNDMLEEN